MFWTIAVTALCTAAVGFYVWFVIALCKDCKVMSSGHWMLVRVHPGPNPILTFKQNRKPISRAA